MPKKKKTTEEKETKKQKSQLQPRKPPLQANRERKRPQWLLLPRWTFGECLTMSLKDSEAIFEDLLFPSYWDRELSLFPETRIPAVDLEDREKDYILKAEMPGFKKEDIEIEVKEDSVEITGKVGWKNDKKEQAYICKERACESFYRMVELPEEIKLDEGSANLLEGVLEITLPKKAPKQKRKVSIK